ncbi:hypothetical protein GGI35DRAFT_375539 [Trichoderma velutinum]
MRRDPEARASCCNLLPPCGISSEVRQARHFRHNNLFSEYPGQDIRKYRVGDGMIRGPAFVSPRTGPCMEYQDIPRCSVRRTEQKSRSACVSLEIRESYGTSGCTCLTVLPSPPLPSPPQQWRLARNDRVRITSNRRLSKTRTLIMTCTALL